MCLCVREDSKFGCLLLRQIWKRAVSLPRRANDVNVAYVGDAMVAKPAVLGKSKSECVCCYHCCYYYCCCCSSGCKAAMCWQRFCNNDCIQVP